MNLDCTVWLILTGRGWDGGSGSEGRRGKSKSKWWWEGRKWRGRECRGRRRRVWLWGGRRNRGQTEEEETDIRVHPRGSWYSAFFHVLLHLLGVFPDSGIVGLVLDFFLPGFPVRYNPTIYISVSTPFFRSFLVLLFLPMFLHHAPILALQLFCVSYRSYHHVIKKKPTHEQCHNGAWVFS